MSEGDMGTYEALQREFDLRYRPKAGDESFYRLDIVYRTLEELGTYSAREGNRGDFKRVVGSVDDAGAVRETITWNNVCRREAKGDEPFSPWEHLTWADGFEYPFSAEEPYDKFHWNYESFPRDQIGWFVLLLTVDAHFEFDYLRSTRHGAIERLRRIGDRVVSPDSNEPFWLGLPPIVDVPAFNKQNLRTTFEGLTTRNGHDCALLRFEMDRSPFEMVFGEERVKASSTFEGTLTVRLADGSLEHGEFLEYVFQSVGTVSPIYEITRIDEASYTKGYD
ncbi:MAG: hypothetical protein ACRDJ1_09895 [Actinomycetota bacterium]